MKIALVSSVGGHLTELLRLVNGIDAETVWILNDRSPVLPATVSAFQVVHAERDLRVLWNIVEFAAILSREEPHALVSTGAGPAVPAALVARLAGIPVIYIEPSSAVERLTLTGRIMRFLATDFFVQWEGLARKNRWAQFAGSVI